MTNMPEIPPQQVIIDPRDCREAMSRLWDYLDGELSEEKMEEVRQHLSICAGCYRHYDFALGFLAALRVAQSEDHADEKLRSSVMTALRGQGFRPEFGEGSDE